MRVLAFGTYQRDYPRVAQVLACLRLAGIDVAERHVSVWEGKRENWSAGAAAAGRLVLAESRLLARRVVDGAGVLYVGYPGHFDLTAARRTAGDRPVVFDPLVSLYETLVDDRRRFRPGSLRARALDQIDRHAFRAADLVVADTVAHAAYFADRFGLEAHQLAVCLVGADDDLFVPAARPEPAVDALFVGKLIPLHGLSTILAAAELVPHCRFRVVGEGQLAAVLARRRPPNVEWTPWLAYEELPGAYRAAACALGVFGSGPKTGRVIPNKAFHALATSTPLITADTPAARELVTHDRDAILVPAGDPAALAEAVDRLAAHPAEAHRIGAAGRLTYEARAARPALAAQWQAVLTGLLRR